MKRVGIVATVVVTALIAASAGYLAGERNNGSADQVQATSNSAEGAQTQRKVLYYRNPMGLPDTSPVPKKDPMGMDYIPVYEGEEEASSSSANQVKISAEKVQKLGVRTEKAKVRKIDTFVRAAGRIEADERRVFTVSPKFEGYVERLHVNVTGQSVSKGQPLFEVYSPELVSAQREYAIAAQGVQSLGGADGSVQAGMKQLADSSLARLRNWDISEEQIRSLARSGEPKRTMTLRSPASGIVMEKKAVQGMRFMPGEMLYQVADLSTVWLLADVFEQDIGLLSPGTTATVKINAYPDKAFSGTVTYIYPTLNTDTRTAQVRVEMPNPSQLLKPGMFANVELASKARDANVAIPTSAVIDSGTRQVALIQVGEGRFEPREVKLGARGGDYVEVLSGVSEGEEVVVAANFLIDAESNLKGALGSFGHGSHGSGASPQSTAPAAASAPSTTGHRGEGTVESIDVSAGTVSLNHGAIASLKWPAMTMDFQVANSSLLKGIKPGTPVTFEFVERGQGEWVITSIQGAAVQKQQGPAPSRNAHTGH